MTVWTRTRLAAALALVAALAVLPVARAEVIVGVDDAATQSIFTFESSAPGTLLFATAITGLGVNDQIVGIDYRAADGELYALVQDLVANTTSLWAIHGATTVRVTPLAAFSAANAGLDFNAVVDRARAVDTDAVSARFSPTGSAEVIDSAVAYPAAGDPNSGQAPAVGAVAYVNPFPGATSTTLFDLDASTDDLAIQNPPNAGVLNTVGSTGVDFSADVGFDIGASGAAFASVHTGGATSSLASVNLATGQLSNLTQIGGGGFTAPNIAVVPSGVLGVEDVAVAEANGTAFVTVARRAGSVGTVGVSYTTAPGTAASELDYTTVSGTLTFQPGETEKVIAVPIVGDAVPENTEALTVNLGSPTGGATIGDAQGIVAILDQSGSGPQGRPPTVRITAPAAGVSFPAPGAIAVAADATDDGGVARVVFLHDGLVIGEDREAPYTASFTPGGEDVGPAEVSAMAFDGGEQTASDTVGFTVERFRGARLSLAARRRGRIVTAAGTLDPPDGVTAEQTCSGIVGGAGAPSRPRSPCSTRAAATERARGCARSAASRCGRATRATPCCGRCVRARGGCGRRGRAAPCDVSYRSPSLPPRSARRFRVKRDQQRPALEDRRQTRGRIRRPAGRDLGSQARIDPARVRPEVHSAEDQDALVEDEREPLGLVVGIAALSIGQAPASLRQATSQSLEPGATRAVELERHGRLARHRVGIGCEAVHVPVRQRPAGAHREVASASARPWLSPKHRDAARQRHEEPAVREAHHPRPAHPRARLAPPAIEQLAALERWTSTRAAVPPEAVEGVRRTRPPPGRHTGGCKQGGRCRVGLAEHVGLPVEDRDLAALSQARCTPIERLLALGGQLEPRLGGEADSEPAQPELACTPTEDVGNASQPLAVDRPRMGHGAVHGSRSNLAIRSRASPLSGRAVVAGDDRDRDHAGRGSQPSKRPPTGKPAAAR